MEQFCKQNHFSRQQLQAIILHEFPTAFHIPFWGLGRGFGSNLCTTATHHWLCQGNSERKRVLPQGNAVDPEKLIFITKTNQKQYFSCIVRCGQSQKSGVQEKLKFERSKGVLGGPEAHIWTAERPQRGAFCKKRRQKRSFWRLYKVLGKKRKMLAPPLKKKIKTQQNQ